MLLLHAPNACDRNRAISCTNDLACLLALLELILFNRLPNKTEYPASTQNQTKESINIMNCWIIIAALNPPGTLNAHRADGWWRCCRRSPALDTGTAGRAWRWAAPWTAGPQKGWSILWKDVERCGKVLRRNQKSHKMSHMRDLWDLWDSLSALSSAKPPKTNTSGEVASQGNSAWRLLGQHECCFQQCGTQAAWGTACPHSLHINVSTELLHAYDTYDQCSSKAKI